METPRDETLPRFTEPKMTLRTQGADVQEPSPSGDTETTAVLEAAPSATELNPFSNVFQAVWSSRSGDPADNSETRSAANAETGPTEANPGGPAGSNDPDAAPSNPLAGNAVSGNPAAVNIVTGTGKLGDALGLNHDGIRFGGLNITDANGVLAGGLGPGKWDGNSLTIADLSIDTEKLFDWKGGLFGMQFLYFSSGGPGYNIAGIRQGQNNVNALAGTVMGFNSLVVVAPFSRAELYQLWYRQEFFDKRLVIRMGKSVPTYDFNNVVRAVPFEDQAYQIPAVTSVLYTPIFINPTMLGPMPGYYNSSTGVVASLFPTERFYLQYGFFDGNLARGVQTGLTGPHFNGYYFHIGEIGMHWTLGPNKLPGKFGTGAWGQTGKLDVPGGSPINGETGYYLFGSQRLYYEQPGKTSDGLSSYYQFGYTNSPAISTHRYFGFGLTYFGPIRGRDHDSLGFGLGYGVMNNNSDAGSIYFNVPSGTSLRTNRLGQNETILTWYYQMQLKDGLLVQPNLTYIVNPARHPGIPNAFAVTLRAIMLF